MTAEFCKISCQNTNHKQIRFGIKKVLKNLKLGGDRC